MGTPVYYARCLCGCGSVVVMVVDDKASREQVAKAVARLIRGGYTVLHDVLERPMVQRCVQRQASGQQQALALPKGGP